MRQVKNFLWEPTTMMCAAAGISSLSTFSILLALTVEPSESIRRDSSSLSPPSDARGSTGPLEVRRGVGNSWPPPPPDVKLADLSFKLDLEDSIEAGSLSESPCCDRLIQGAGASGLWADVGVGGPPPLRCTRPPHGVCTIPGGAGGARRAESDDALPAAANDQRGPGGKPGKAAAASPSRAPLSHLPGSTPPATGAGQERAESRSEPSPRRHRGAAAPVADAGGGTGGG
mmetsp:Transcript_30558/g.63912  ORF Transcript_30558/g.63912 Transcript_30558/m.63912 type:complete len:230 (-) Transcript_30558:246-935(-)